MIQRIQSIFLFLAAACGFGILAAPFATTPETVQSSSLFSDAQFSVGDNIGLLALFAVAGALALAGLFLFKNRQTQMKICRFAIIANVLGLVLAIILFWQDNANIATSPINDGASAYLPFGFLLFGILALRFIRKDENLVKSMDRLR
jgi:glucan phosphoethanolaminetransferase (alkaline phosphatase superfamily)